MAVDWQKLATKVDRIAVRTFDHGGGDPNRQPLYQLRLRGANDGAAFPLPAIFDAGHQEVRPDADVKISGIEAVLDVHFGDFPAGKRPRIDDRVTIRIGPASGLYKVDDVQANDDQTGARLPLKKIGPVP